MKKEDVLRIKSVRMNAEYTAVAIDYQNLKILKRGKFVDKEIGVKSAHSPAYYQDMDELFIWGNEKNKDNKVFVVKNRQVQKILDKVDKINEKYGIVKRWRAEEREIYFYIGGTEFVIYCNTEAMGVFDDTRWDVGNYFKTREEAEKLAKK